MENADAPEVLQNKLYFLVEQLQNMARDLPPYITFLIQGISVIDFIIFRKYQMRVPYELLSSLANCLLNETVFEIVKGLMEIQHVTEQHLYQQRLQFINQKKGNCAKIKRKLLNYIVAAEEQDLLNKYEANPEKKVEALNKLMIEQKEDLKRFDMSLVVQLDQKVYK